MILSPEYMGIYVISGIFMLIGWLVGSRLKARMKEYSQIRTRSGFTGKQVAEAMLRANGINDVKVTGVDGFLTDHYNPLTKTVNLSPEVYNTPSVAAAAVAAHEVGHAVQHARGYAWLTMRSALVPVVRISGFLVQFVIIAGILLINTFPDLLLAGIFLFAATTLFTVITLPVEFDASRRALVWLQESQIATGREYEMARNGLRWAASTYIVAALQSVATLLYYIMIYLARRR